jgi:lysophospholipase L1-like esterase
MAAQAPAPSRPTPTWTTGFEIVLTVTEAGGAISADTTSATVANVAPVVDLTLSAQAVLVGAVVNATASFTDPGEPDSPWQWELDWEDGTVQSGSAASVATAITGSHAYQAPGTYTVRITVTDGDGGAGMTELSVNVSALPAVRIVTFGDSNTDNGWSGTSPVIMARAYISKVPGRLGPDDPHHPTQLAGKVVAAWTASRMNPITVVNQGIGGTTTGGGAFGGPDRHSSGSPQARTVVNSITRFEAEVLGRGIPAWHGGEPVNSVYPEGPLPRSNGYSPGAGDFAYVSMGTNDPSSGIPTAKTLLNLRWMIETWIADGLPPSHFILTTLPPTIAPDGADFPALNQGIRSLAAEKRVHFIDLAAHTAARSQLRPAPQQVVRGPGHLRPHAVIHLGADHRRLLDDLLVPTRNVAMILDHGSVLRAVRPDEVFQYRNRQQGPVPAAGVGVQALQRIERTAGSGMRRGPLPGSPPAPANRLTTSRATWPAVVNLTATTLSAPANRPSRDRGSGGA